MYMYMCIVMLSHVDTHLCGCPSHPHHVLHHALEAVSGITQSHQATPFSSGTQSIVRHEVVGTTISTFIDTYWLGAFGFGVFVSCWFSEFATVAV